jgi:hypothetical protein
MNTDMIDAYDWVRPKPRVEPIIRPEAVELERFRGNVAAPGV